MPVTRSRAKQTHLDDFVQVEERPAKDESPAKRKEDPKRKATAPRFSEDKAESTKRKRGQPAKAKSMQDDPSKKDAKEEESARLPEDKGTDGSTSNHEPSEDISALTINRAPVLHLWAACVSHFIRPSLPWTTCLSAGSAVSSLCAIAKGRSIGVLPEPEERNAKDKKHNHDEQLVVMQFKLRRNKDGLIIVGKDNKQANEAVLVRKFGGQAQFDAVRKLFEQCLNSWKGQENELNDKAFGFYEKFRPSVTPGQSGWGRKGALAFDKIKETVVKK